MTLVTIFINKKVYTVCMNIPLTSKVKSLVPLLGLGFLVLATLVLGLGLMKKTLITDSDDIATSGYGPLGYGRGNSQRNQQNQQMRGSNLGGSNSGVTKGNCLMDGCLLVEDAEYPVATLSSERIEHLNVALADERKALGFYQTVMAEFGEVKPFVNIARAEEHHIAMLLALFDKYGVEIPADSTPQIEVPKTLAEACQAGVTAEIDNDALYQEMLPSIVEEDISAVFTSLADASREMHLPAFKRCAL